MMPVLLARFLPYLIPALIGAVLAGSIAWKIQQWRLDAAIAERDAALQSYQIAKDDAGRWKTASEMRDLNITALSSQLDECAKLARDTTAAASTAVAEAASRESATKKKLDEIRRTANASSDKPRPLGPAARSAFEWLRERAASFAAAHPRTNSN